MNNFTLGSVKLETLFVPLAIRSSTKSGCQAKGNAIEDALIINQCVFNNKKYAGYLYPWINSLTNNSQDQW